MYKQKFGINFLKQEIKRCEQLKIKNLVLHPGSHVNLGVSKGLNNIINALNRILTKDTFIIFKYKRKRGKIKR